jgi:hypothetical protein
MMHRHIVSLLFAGAVLLLASCSVSKHIPPGDKLYGGAIVKVDSANLSSEIKEEISALPRPKANTNILGVRYKLMFYDAVPESTKKKGFLKLTLILQKWDVVFLEYKQLLENIFIKTQPN